MLLISLFGVVFIVVDELFGFFVNVVFNFVLFGWFVFFFIMLMVLLFGIIMWGLVSKICFNYFIIFGSYIYC